MSDAALANGVAHADGREANVPRSYYRAPDGAVHRDLLPRELKEALRTPGGVLWVDVDVTNRHQHAVLEKVFGFHPLAIEDTLNPESRVKLEEYGEYLFAIVRGVRLAQETEDPYDYETRNLCFFLGAHYLVTTHFESSTSCAAVAERLTRSPDLLDRGPARLMHQIMDTAVDAYFPIVDAIDDFIEGLEERVFVSFDEAALRSVFTVKRLVVSLRRHLAPQREVFNVLTNRPTPLLNHEAQLYFRDIYDHVLRMNEAFDTQRDLLSSTLDAYLSQVSNRLGTVTKGLSVIATLSVPFVMVSGMWGMNFDRIPLARHPHGFALMVALQLAAGAGLVALLKWRRWL